MTHIKTVFFLDFFKQTKTHYRNLDDFKTYSLYFADSLIKILN